MATSYLLPLGARPKEHSNDQEVTLPSNLFHVWRVWSFERLLLKLKVRRFSEKHFSPGMTGFWSVSDDDHHLQIDIVTVPVCEQMGLQL
ncbi:uncharacterized protein [Pocillopora verrucosa]|uniref:uncharacterized protein isoform X4 n=1 Tax=Pocillopora verrucosa TaxID=203993 RepID=UPI00333E6BBC